MSEKKYSQYFIRGPKPGVTSPAMLSSVAHLDGERIKGAPFYFSFNFLRPDEQHRAHGPHTHPYPEVLGYFGTNPADPLDLGAEMELGMGEEVEMHAFNKSTVIYVPPNFVHGPLKYNKIYRPFIFIMAFPASERHEKSYKHLVSEAERSTMVFFDE